MKMKKVADRDKYNLPTSQSIDLARKLGIKFEGLTAGQLSRAISGTLRRRTLNKQKAILSALLEQGLCVGSLVKGNTFVGWIRDIRLETGEVLIHVYGTGARFWKAAGMLELLEVPESPSDFFDFDEWTPPGFKEVKGSVLTRILSGDFGEAVKGDLKMRDSFFASGDKRRKYLLFSSTLARIQAILEREQQVKTEEQLAQVQASRQKRDQKFCAQCGKAMVRSQEAFQEWLNQQRCADCQEHPIRLREGKHCVQCGVRFEPQKEESPGAWGGRKKCPSCRQKKLSPEEGI
jgi:hypothetical protein